MPDSVLRPSYVLLIFGIFSLFMAVLGTCTGVTGARYGGWVYRDKEPTQYWWTVALYFFGGVFFVGIFLYKVYGLSN